MHTKALTTLLLTTAALGAAAPAPAAEPAPDTSAYPSIEIIYANVPTSILTVLETAIPTPWLESIYSDPAFRSVEASDIMHGTYPAWYNSLPQSVKDWGTSAAMAEASDYPYSSFVWSEVPYPTPLVGSGSVGSSGVVSSTPLSSMATASTSTATATETTTKGGSGGSSSASSGSGSGSTSTSTAGAPAATGGVAMSLAGAAGILGLALAL